MAIKLVLDTNAVNNKSLSGKLFGNHDVLKRLQDNYQIYVPEIVIEELKEHKRRAMQKDKDDLIQNKLLKFIGLDIYSLLKDLDINQYVDDDIKKEEINFQVLSHGDLNVFYKNFCQHLLRNKAPFAKEGDRGFKDALIAQSVDILLEKCVRNEKIVLVSSDTRLIEYFQNNPKVIIQQSLDAVSRLTINSAPTTQNRGLGTNHSSIKLPAKTSRQRAKDKMLTNFRNSPSFKKTHELIKVLRHNKKLFDINDKKDIIMSTINNSQIGWVANDYDVYPFLLETYNDCKDKLTRQQKSAFLFLLNDQSTLKESAEKNDDGLPF